MTITQFCVTPKPRIKSYLTEGCSRNTPFGFKKVPQEVPYGFIDIAREHWINGISRSTATPKGRMEFPPCLHLCCFSMVLISRPPETSFFTILLLSQSSRIHPTSVRNFITYNIEALKISSTAL